MGTWKVSKLWFMALLPVVLWPDAVESKERCNAEAGQSEYPASE
jgi:hypothetical protein